jgi:hypothetical protein
MAQKNKCWNLTLANGFWGKGRKLSEIHKKRISENHVGMLGKHHSAEAKTRISIANKRTRKPLTAEHKQKISIRLKERIFSEEAKRKISESCKKSWLDKARKPQKNGYGIKTRYQNILFRSRMEASFAKWLDSKNIRWIYEPERFKISIGSYLPDFYLPDKNIWIEVKGRKYINGMKKFECFKKEYNVKVILADTNYFKKKGIQLNG